MKITQQAPLPGRRPLQATPPDPAPLPPDHVRIGGKDMPIHKASLGTKIGIGVCALAGGVCIANLVSQVAAQPTVGGVVAAVAGVAGSALGGFLAADFASGLFHHGVENYARPGDPIIGELAADFTSHHYFTNNLEASTMAGNMNPAAELMAPLLVGLAAWNPHFAVTSAALAVVGGALSSRASHRWTHETQPPPMVKTLRRLGLAQSTEDHREHHKAPWATNFCILNGSLNPVLDKVHFWRKYEKAIYDVTGAEPKTWKHPAVREFALGKIDEAEYKRRYVEDIPLYKQAIDFAREKEEARAFIHNRYQ